MTQTRKSSGFGARWTPCGGEVTDITLVVSYPGPPRVHDVRTAPLDRGEEHVSSRTCPSVVGVTRWPLPLP